MIAAKFRIMTIEQRAVRRTAENFVICDTQKSYSENLFRRLSEKLSGYFQFHVFHDIENLKIAAKSMQVNILLIGEEYGKEDRDEIPARQKYLLIGEKIPNERSPTEIPFFRYQSVSSMLELLLQEKVQENSEVQTHQIQLVSERPQTVKAMTLTWEKGEQAEISNGTANNIAEIKYTSKGYLIYSYEYIVAHAALKEYYRVKPLSDTLRILTDQYVSVFNYLNYNFLTQNWDESNVETILLPRLFEDLYQVHTGEQLKKDSGRISAEIYENVMIACLPVTIEELRKHCGYDMESNTYDSGTFFYRGTSPFGEVVDYLDNSDGTLTLYVDAVWPDRNTDCAFKNEIVIKPYGDGTCQYLSNKVQKIELDIPVYEEY